MKFLVTNDDGIAAPGLQVLVEAAVKLGESIVVAPHEAHSGCSHRVTTDKAIRVSQQSSYAYAVEGTPADCVRVGLHSLATDVDWVLSGVNAGGNLGTDVHLSGTVAAVREAVLLGKPGIALSQYRRKGSVFDWQRAYRWLVPVIRQLMAQPWTPGTFWNVNFPDPVDCDTEPKVVFCPLDHHPLPVLFLQDEEHFHYNGDYHGRLRDDGSDVAECFRGNIAVTRINLRGLCDISDR